MAWARPTHSYPSARGFTLIEAMITVLLVGILVAIALPAYGRYSDRAKMVKAIADIGAVSLQIELHSENFRALPANLTFPGSAIPLDPWGRPYVYYNVVANGHGHARKDHALNPINTDYDLYSLGPDGKTKPQITQKDSLDDIIRASNGRFIGAATSF